MKVLIADDDLISRTFLERTLRNLKHEVTSCADGEEAWKVFLKSPCSIVISDWTMPGISGLDLCKRIRGLNHANYCYFVIVTGRTSKADSLEAMDAGADDFLTKPIDPVDIEARLRVAERILVLQKLSRGANVKEPAKPVADTLAS